MRPRDATHQLASLRARLARARDELAQAEKHLEQTVELTAVVGRLSEFGAQVRDGLDHLDWHQRRQLIRTLVARVEVEQDGATVVYRVPPPSDPHCNGGGPGTPTDGSGETEVIPLRGGSEHPPLGCTPCRFLTTLQVPVPALVLNLDRRLQPQLDELKHPTVAHPARDAFHQLRMRNVVEVFGQVSIDDQRVVLPQGLVDASHRLLGTAPGTIPIRTVVEVSLEDGFENQLGGGLHHAVSDSRDPERPFVDTTGFRDHDPLDGLGAVSSSSQLFVDLAEPPLHSVRFNVLERLPVDACSAAVAPALRIGEGEDIHPRHLVVEEVKSTARLLLGLAVKHPSEPLELLWGL